MCVCTSDNDCPSNQVCYLGDNKCYSSGLSLGQSCTADNGDDVDTRCTSGKCGSPIVGQCGCTSDSHCSSNQVCYSGDNKCYSSGLSLGQSCAADNGGDVDTRCASDNCHNSQCVECLTDLDCSSNQVCYSVDNKCYSSGLSYGQSCAADNGDDVDTRCASGSCHNSDKVCVCTSDSHCSSSQVCYLGDNKCYSSGLSLGQSCLVNGDPVEARCASGICFSTDNTCGCTSNDHCPSDQACYSSENGDNKCYSIPSSSSIVDIGFYQLSTIQEPSCPSGLELSQAECEPAALSLGLDYNNAFQVGGYNHIPCGCSYMSEAVGGVTNKLVYNTHTVNCQWETRTIGNLCKPIYQLSTIQEPSCPSGLELSQTECEPAALSLGLDYNNVFQVGGYNHIPCGCSYMSEAVGGVTNKLVYNTNTVNCQWETRTIGNLCELPLLSVSWMILWISLKHTSAFRLPISLFFSLF